VKSNKKPAAKRRKTVRRHASKSLRTKSKAWTSYEQVATDLIERFRKEFGLASVEKKQKVQGHDTVWEIDGKGLLEGNQGFLVVECRRYLSKKQNQQQLGSLAYSIIDTGAAGGIIVSPLGLQEGAARIAASRNVIDVKLGPKSTPEQFAIQFLDKLFLGIRAEVKSSAAVHPRYIATCTKCGKKFEVFDENVANDEHVCDDCAGRS
jgi:hypothetical protein